LEVEINSLAKTLNSFVFINVCKINGKKGKNRLTALNQIERQVNDQCIWIF